MVVDDFDVIGVTVAPAEADLAFGFHARGNKPLLL